jgi:hypothetical protein
MDGANETTRLATCEKAEEVKSKRGKVKSKK